MKKNYIVTGCAGFIGFHLCKYLLKKKNYVIGIDKISNYYSKKLKNDRLNILKKHSNFFFYKKNLNNLNLYNSLKKKIKVKPISAIFHLAAQAGVKYSLVKPYQYISDNILAYTKICEFAKDNCIKRVIYASSSSIYGESNLKSYSENLPLQRPLSLYSATKQSVEQISSFYSKFYKIKFIGLRIFTSYGPFGRPDLSVFQITNDIIKKKEVTLLNYGKIKRDFTYIDDTIRGIILASRYKFKRKNYHIIFNIGSGKSYNIYQLTNMISKILKIKCKIKFKKKHAADMNLTLSNINFSKISLNFRAKTALETGLKKFIEWYLQYNKK